MRNRKVDPQTLLPLEAAFDEAWLTLKTIGNTMVKPDELVRAVLRLAMEGERDPVRLHNGALNGLLRPITWREADRAEDIENISSARLNVRFQG